MKGTEHYVAVTDEGVEIGNIEDTCYYCVFETPEELQAFIAELQKAGREKFSL